MHTQCEHTNINPPTHIFLQKTLFRSRLSKPISENSNKNNGRHGLIHQNIKKEEEKNDSSGPPRAKRESLTPSCLLILLLSPLPPSLLPSYRTFHCHGMPRQHPISKEQQPSTQPSLPPSLPPALYSIVYCSSQEGREGGREGGRARLPHLDRHGMPRQHHIPEEQQPRAQPS
jgi:hypothetical protein